MTTTRWTWLRCAVCGRDVWSEEGGYVALHFTDVTRSGAKCNGSGGLSVQEMEKEAEA